MEYIGGHWFMKKTWSRKSRVRLPLSVFCGSDMSMLFSDVFRAYKDGSEE